MGDDDQDHDPLDEFLPSPAVSEEEEDLEEQLLDGDPVLTKINAYLAAELPVLAIPTILKLSVWIEKLQGYRTQPMMLTQEFFCSAAYRGAKNKLIFKLKPVDAQIYEHAEAPEKKLLKVWPSMEETLIEALLGEDWDANSLAEAKQSIVDEHNRKIEEAAQKARQAEVDLHANNPNWGMF